MDKKSPFSMLKIPVIQIMKLAVNSLQTARRRICHTLTESGLLRSSKCL